DGDYLYHLAQGTLNIVKADGQGHMHQVCAMQMQYQNSDFYPLDMYVDGSRLCVIGTEFSYQYQPEITDSSAKYYHYAGKNFVKALVYNIEDKSAPALIKEFSAEGDLLTSRKVDNILYLVLNYNMSFYGLAEPSQAVPLYYDSTFFSNTKAAPLEFGNMRYFPGAENESMLIISGMDITDPDSAAQTTSIIGSGSTVYMSRSALYIAKYSYGFSPFLRIMPIDDADSNVGGGQARDNTTFFKFALDNGFAIYQGSGEADGTVLNQYSMDEYNGYFRAAMTVNTLGGSSKNALNIFDAGMALCGSITDMAPGERVYSARFMGERAFMVTYRTVDPLFALDLSNPYSPRVLGELKIPGYSSYLHPYDENHLIGFGRETEELTTIDSKGKVVDVRAVNRGLKLALFDISDMTNPKELHVVTIGDENTYSELLNNPKALLFSKEKGFIAFPVNDYGYSAGEAKAFNGAHVYNISPAGIDLRGVINQAGANRNDHKYWYYDNNIQRILYIGNTFYSASESGLQSNDMESLKLIEFLQYGK
ncbi:MAG: beta-propeller domain-containing protein, partial [Clostridiales bacterium]|nr:beta-propeller domain-containing protein [Clostridiales bacterium]